MRARAPETALQRQDNPRLPALCQYNILGRDRAQIAFREPVHQRGAQPLIPPQAGIAQHIKVRRRRHTGQNGGDRRPLPDIGQLRAAQVDDARIVAPGAREYANGISQKRLRGTKARPHRGDEGAAPHGGLQQPLLRHHLIGPRHGAGRHAQPPGQVAHRRQAGAFGQFSAAHRMAQPVGQGEVFRTVEIRQIRLPFCIHDNSFLASDAAICNHTTTR